MFHGSMVALVTPMRANGEVDYDALARLVDFHVENGTNAIVAVGTTGESATLDFDDHTQVMRKTVEFARGRVPVIGGTGSNSTQEAIELTRAAMEDGCDGALLVTPYYNKPTQEGVAVHFETVAAATGLPVMLYDIPGRTGLAIAEDTYRRVAGNERIVAVKDAVGDLGRGVRVMSETGLAFYSGDDVLNLGWLTHGAAGVVSVVGHVAGREHAAMVAAVDRGDLAAALDFYRRLVPVVDAVMNKAPGAMMAKAAMQLLGVLPSRTMRLPLVAASDDLVENLRAALGSASLLEEPAS
jgi:4-hydroxy-tetrahydrodipicolinate synthase